MRRSINRCIIVVVMIFVFDRSHSHTSHTSEVREQVTNELSESRIRNSKIPLRHLKPCLDQHLENSCQLAIEEFSDLRKGLLQEATVGLLPENKKKNRYALTIIN